jgi:hypothetical protein
MAIMLIVEIILRLVKAFHLAVIVYMLFGWCSSEPNHLMAHIIIVLTIITHWRFNDGKCILTDLEYLLKSKQLKSSFINTDYRSKTELTGIVSEPFTKRIFSTFGITMSDKSLKLVTYAVLYLAVGISIFKIL